MPGRSGGVVFPTWFPDIVTCGPPCGAAPGGSVGVTLVIKSPNLGVFAVAAAGVLGAFPACWTHYLNSVSAAGPARTSLSLLFLGPSSYSVNAVQLHVNAADALVRHGVDRDDSR